MKADGKHKPKTHNTPPEYMTDSENNTTRTTDMTFLMGIGHTPSGPRLHTSIVIDNKHFCSAVFSPEAMRNGSLLFILQKKINDMVSHVLGEDLGFVRVSLVNGVHVAHDHFAIPMFEYNDHTLVWKLTEGLKQFCREINGTFMSQPYD